MVGLLVWNHSLLGCAPNLRRQTLYSKEKPSREAPASLCGTGHRGWDVEAACAGTAEVDSKDCSPEGVD